MVPGHDRVCPGGRSGRRDLITKGATSALTSSNLIVTVTDEPAGQRVLETLLSLGTRHPSRAIVLQADPGADGNPLDARIGTHCRNGESGAGWVCFEQLALTVRGEAARHLDGTVTPLMIHDLPTHVWWPHEPPFGDPIFDQLVELADRLVVNSSNFSDLLAGLRRLGVIRRRAGVGDIAWERLAPWQELTPSSSTPALRRSAHTCLDCASKRRSYPSSKSGRRRARDGHRVGLTGGPGGPVRGLDRDRLAWRRRSPRNKRRRRVRIGLEGRYERSSGH